MELDVSASFQTSILLQMHEIILSNASNLNMHPRIVRIHGPARHIHERKQIPERLFSVFAKVRVYFAYSRRGHVSVLVVRQSQSHAGSNVASCQ